MGKDRGHQNGNDHGTVPGIIAHLKKCMTASLSSHRILLSGNNEKEVILCLVIKGSCREALFLFGGLRSSLLGARKTEPSRGKTNDKRFFDTRSRKRGFKPLFFWERYREPCKARYRASRSFRHLICRGEIPQQPPIIPAPAAAQRSA